MEQKLKQNRGLTCKHQNNKHQTQNKTTKHMSYHLHGSEPALGVSASNKIDLL